MFLEIPHYHQVAVIMSSTCAMPNTVRHLATDARCKGLRRGMIRGNVTEDIEVQVLLEETNEKF